MRYETNRIIATLLLRHLHGKRGSTQARKHVHGLHMIYTTYASVASRCHRDMYILLSKSARPLQLAVCPLDPSIILARELMRGSGSGTTRSRSLRLSCENLIDLFHFGLSIAQTDEATPPAWAGPAPTFASIFEVCCMILTPAVLLLRALLHSLLLSARLCFYVM